jgi:hypothetical protein
MKKQGLRGAKGPIITLGIIAILFAIVGFNFYYQSRQFSPSLITKDLALFTEIFKKIDDKCKIMSFDNVKNPINFLNTSVFTGSEVGPMNLAYPTEWEGPYVKENPKVQGIEYQVIKTKKGLFITPGDGVYLPNDVTIGEDIKLDGNSDIEAMMKDENALAHKGVAFAVPLKLSSTEWQKLLLQRLPDGGML